MLFRSELKDGMFVTAPFKRTDINTDNVSNLNTVSDPSKFKNLYINKEIFALEVQHGDVGLLQHNITRTKVEMHKIAQQIKEISQRYYSTDLFTNRNINELNKKLEELKEQNKDVRYTKQTGTKTVTTKTGSNNTRLNENYYRSISQFDEEYKKVEEYLETLPKHFIMTNNSTVSAFLLHIKNKKTISGIVDMFDRVIEKEAEARYKEVIEKKEDELIDDFRKDRRDKEREIDSRFRSVYVSEYEKQIKKTRIMEQFDRSKWDRIDEPLEELKKAESIKKENFKTTLKQEINNALRQIHLNYATTTKEVAITEEVFIKGGKYDQDIEDINNKISTIERYRVQFKSGISEQLEELHKYQQQLLNDYDIDIENINYTNPQGLYELITVIHDLMSNKEFNGRDGENKSYNLIHDRTTKDLYHSGDFVDDLKKKGKLINSMYLYQLNSYINSIYKDVDPNNTLKARKYVENPSLDIVDEHKQLQYTNAPYDYTIDKKDGKYEMYSGYHIPLFVDARTFTTYIFEWTGKYPTLSIFTPSPILVKMANDNVDMSLEKQLEYFEQNKTKFDEDTTLEVLDKIKNVIMTIMGGYHGKMLQTHNLFIDPFNLDKDGKPLKVRGTFAFMDKQDIKSISSRISYLDTLGTLYSDKPFNVIIGQNIRKVNGLEYSEPYNSEMVEYMKQTQNNSDLTTLPNGYSENSQKLLVPFYNFFDNLQLNGRNQSWVEEFLSSLSFTNNIFTGIQKPEYIDDYNFVYNATQEAKKDILK